MSTYRVRVFLVLLALTICAGALQGAALVANSTGTSMTCNASATTTSSTLTVTLTLPSGGTAATSVTVSQSLPSGQQLTVTGPGTNTGVTASGGTTWTFKEPAGCLPAGTDTITFTPTGGNTSAVQVVATLGTPTNTYLAISGAGSSALNPLPVTCNASSGVTTGTVNVSPVAGLSGLTASNKLAVGIAQIVVTADSTPTTYSGGTLASSPVTVAGAGSFYQGTLPLTAGIKTPRSGLSASSNATTAQVTFTSAVGSSTAFNDTVLLYVKVTQTAPVTVPGSLTLQCLPGSASGTPVVPPANNLTISTLSSSAVNVSVTSSGWISVAAGSGSAVAGGPVTGSATSNSSLAISAAPNACDGLKTAGQSASGSITVAPGSGSPWSSVSVPVTLQVVTPSPLTATPPTLPLVYRKGGPAATGTIAVSSSSAMGSYFTVVGVTGLGAYITADTASGSAPKAPATRVITFSTTSLNDSLAPGTTTYTVNLHVAGCADYPVKIQVTVNDAAPVLSVAEGTTRSLTWDPSTNVLSPVVTLVSSDSPIAFSVTGMTGIVTGILPANSGLAFSYGTQVNVVFDPSAFQSASPGQTLTGKLTITGGGTTITITFNVLVTSSSTQASLGAISPSNLPTGTPGQVFTLNLYGSGFVSSATPGYTTVVGLASSPAAAGFAPHEPGISSVKVLNSSTIVMTLTVPPGGSDVGSGGLLNFNTPGSIYIGVCNPNGSNCTPSYALQLTIGSGPVISAVTSASSFGAFSSSQNGSPAVAPYDMISIFGSNFCNLGGTGCTGLIMGNIVNNAYSTSLTPDGSRSVTVNIYSHPAGTLSSASPIASAPLLFVTNSQINALFPGDSTNNTALSTALGTGWIDVAVNFGGAFSNVVTVASALTDPGIFTIGSDGTGDAAALQTANNSYTLISSTNPAMIRAASADTVQIYGTGLGAPDTTDASCITVSAYDTGASVQTIDGAVLQPAVLGALSAPCFGTPTTSAAVKFGGVASGTENWAGWDIIPGLYSVNATLPTNASSMTDSSGSVTAPFTAPMQVNVTLKGAGSPSQNGVTMWVAPQLTMASFNASCASTTWGTYSCPVPAITGGSGETPAYTYSFTNPSSLTCSTSGSPACTTSSAPNPTGSYLITVTAQDQTYPDTMSVTGSFNIFATDTGQTLAVVGTTPTPSVYGIPNKAVATVSVPAGTSTYSYTVTPTAYASVDSNGNVSFSGSAPVGSNEIVITATDTATNTQVGTLTFYAPVAPQIVSSNGVSLTANATSTNPVTLTTLSALGATGVTYTLLQGPTGASVNGANVIYTGSSSMTAGTYSITVKGVDGSSHEGLINLSLHLN